MQRRRLEKFFTEGVRDLKAQIRDFINIIKSGITQQKESVSADFGIDGFLRLISEHHITAMIYHGLHNCGIAVEEATKNLLLKSVVSQMTLDEKQRGTLSEIRSLFNENSIDYIVLKGSTLKEFYPSPEMRVMSDIDVLIKLRQYETIKKLLKSNGYEEIKETNHELIWKKDGVFIELHKILMPTKNKDFHAYFGDGWKRAVLKEKNEYTFNNEDMFVYLFTHFAKHYREAGIGITHICDLHLYLKETDIDEEYADLELKKLGIYDFYINIKKTMDVWFGEAKDSEITDFITNVIFSSGAYGVYDNFLASTAIREENEYGSYIKGRVFSFLRTLFPTFESMKKRYEALGKLPYLLPVFWIIRLSHIFFKEKTKVENKLNDICAISDKKVREYRESLQYVGLRYNFK